MGGASADRSPVKGKPKRRGSTRLLLVQARGDRLTAAGMTGLREKLCSMLRRG
jgi:hypothetical protein